MNQRFGIGLMIGVVSLSAANPWTAADKLRITYPTRKAIIDLPADRARMTPA
jgi:hypothetical protein